MHSLIRLDFGLSFMARRLYLGLIFWLFFKAWLGLAYITENVYMFCRWAECWPKFQAYGLDLSLNIRPGIDYLWPNLA